jgi:Mrp family chromosome partitioning ATPase
MINEESVKQGLEAVIVPIAMRSVVGLNMVREINISDAKLDVTLASTGLIPGAQNMIRKKAVEVITKLPEAKEVTVNYSSVKAKDLNRIDHMVAVVSGKGGVGKSLVSGLIAISLKRRGYEVGILDADITGPSIPKMFGIKVLPSANEDGMLPVLSKSGIEVMSINLLLPSEDEAVIWRGPLIGNTIKQFGEDVLWGKLDYLIVDLPPGTADAPLTLMQSFPISGVIVVFTPQDLVEMIVKKAVKMAQKMEKKVLGVVENMSYLYVPEIDKKIEVFGKSRADELARVSNSPLLGQIPIDPDLARLCDEGNIERYDSEIVTRLGDSISKLLTANTEK